MANSGWDTDDLIQYEDTTTFALPSIAGPSFPKIIGENIAYSDVTPVSFDEVKGGVLEWVSQGLLFSD